MVLRFFAGISLLYSLSTTACAANQAIWIE